MRVRTDMELSGGPDELDVGCSRPLGHFVFPARMFAMVSQGCGCQGFFDCEEDALPILRMKLRSALLGRSRQDFRLYRWDREQLVWFVALQEVELGSVGKEAPGV